MQDTAGGRTTYIYDAASRIASLHNPEGDRTSYTYDDAGRRILKQLANGTRTSHTYDDAGRLTFVGNFKSNNDDISSFTYTYDAAGNRTNVVESDGDRTTWTYDATYQLTAEHRSGTDAYAHTFTYDPVGNRLTKIEDGDVTTYTYNDANQLTVSRDAAAERVTYTYDADGNQLTVEDPTNDLTTHTWSYENKLIQIEKPLDEVVTYTYSLVKKDNTEQRTTKDDDTTFTRFAWDEDRILAELDDVGTPAAEYTLEPAQYGNLVSQKRDADSSYYHYDALGSTRDLTDDGEVQTDEYSYYAFGKQATSSGSTGNNYQWVGELGCYHDPETGDYTLRARPLRPETGRFLSEDPIRDDEENLYRYVGNNPTNDSDPSGLQPPLRLRPQNAQQQMKALGQIRKVSGDTPIGAMANQLAIGPGGNDYLSDAARYAEHPGTQISHAVPRYRNHRIIGGMGGDIGRSSDRQAPSEFNLQLSQSLRALGDRFLQPEAALKYGIGVAKGMRDSVLDYLYIAQAIWDAEVTRHSTLLTPLTHLPGIGGFVEEQLQASETRTGKRVETSRQLWKALGKSPRAALQMILLTDQVLNSLERENAFQGAVARAAVENTLPVPVSDIGDFAKLFGGDLPEIEWKQVTDRVEALAEVLVVALIDAVTPENVGYVVGTIAWEILEDVILTAITAGAAAATGFVVAKKAALLAKLRKVVGLAKKSKVFKLIEQLLDILSKGRFKSVDELLTKVDEAIASLKKSAGIKKRSEIGEIVADVHTPDHEYFLDADGKWWRCSEVCKAGNAPTRIGAKTWQEYESGIRALYGEASFSSRQYTAMVDGKLVNGVADNVTTIGGRNVAVEAKWVKGSWLDSPRNPTGRIGDLPFAVEEQATMLQQARKYSAAFPEVIYHSNSPELIAHYTRVFQNAGLTNIRFILTQ